MNSVITNSVITSSVITNEYFGPKCPFTKQDNSERTDLAGHDLFRYNRGSL